MYAGLTTVTTKRNTFIAHGDQNSLEGRGLAYKIGMGVRTGKQMNLLCVNEQINPRARGGNGAQ